MNESCSSSVVSRLRVKAHGDRFSSSAAAAKCCIKAALYVHLSCVKHARHQPPPGRILECGAPKNMVVEGGGGTLKETVDSGTAHTPAREHDLDHLSMVLRRPLCEIGSELHGTDPTQAFLRLSKHIKETPPGNTRQHIQDRD